MDFYNKQTIGHIVYASHKVMVTVEYNMIMLEMLPLFDDKNTISVKQSVYRSDDIEQSQEYYVWLKTNGRFLQRLFDAEVWFSREGSYENHLLKPLKKSLEELADAMRKLSPWEITA